MQRDGGLDAADKVLAQRPVHAFEGHLAVVAVSDELADHRIVIGRNRVPAVDMRVDAHAVAAGSIVEPDGAGRRGEVAGGVLGVDAALDRVAPELDVFLVETQLLTGGDADLLLDQVDASDLLGYRMLYLDAGVHLDEVELPLRIDDEFDGALRFRTPPPRQPELLPCPCACGDPK